MLRAYLGNAGNECDLNKKILIIVYLGWFENKHSEYLFYIVCKLAWNFQTKFWHSDQRLILIAL